MKDFEFCSPTEFVFGRGVEQRAGEFCAKCGARRVLVVYGGGSAVKSGLLARVEASLQEAGIAWDSIGGVQPNPLDDKVYEGIRLARESGAGFVLAVGGGSVIDTAKAIAAGVPYGGDFWDFFAGKAVPEAALPVGVVLTIPAAGSEGSGNSVITKADGLRKLSLRTGRLLKPVFALMDPELTYTLPEYQTACGVADMTVHILERYFSRTPGTEVTDRLCEGLLMAIIGLGPKALDAPRDYDVRANLMWAGTLAHNGLCGTGREEDWASHFMEHEVSALYGVAHGAGLAAIVPAWMRYVSERRPERAAQLAVRVFGFDPALPLEAAARHGVEQMKLFFLRMGMPVSFRQMGVDRPDVDLLVRKLHEDKGPVIGGYLQLKADDTRAIYELAR